MNKDELIKKLSDLDLQRRPLVVQLEQVKNYEDKAKNEKLIGTYLMYRNNCFSCPSKPSDYWNNYCLVIGATYYSLEVLEVFKDSHGEITITTKTIPDLALDNYEKIPKKVFDEQYDMILGKIISLRVRA
jgi:hypothetical protein